MAYRKKTYKKKYTPKKKRAYRKKKTFKAKRAGNVQMRPAAMKQIVQRISGLMAIDNRNIVSQQGVPQYCVTGCVSLLNTMGANPINFGQYASVYKNPQCWQVMGVPIANYDEMRAVGFRIKFNLPAGSTFGGNNLISLEIVYDENSLWSPSDNNQVNMAAYSTYQNITFTATKNTFSRYYSLTPLLKKLGLGWTNTKDLPSVILATGGFSYYGQLNSPTSPSIGWRITSVGPIDYKQVIGYMELSWYYQFRGLNYGVGGGVSALTGQAEQPDYALLPGQDNPFIPGVFNEQG